LRGQGILASGHVLYSVGDHASAAKVLAEHARLVDARAIAIGRSPRGSVAQFTDGSFTTTLTRAAHCSVLLLHPGTEPKRLSEATFDELRRDIA
jgi:hypothetical protein